MLFRLLVLLGALVLRDGRGRRDGAAVVLGERVMRRGLPLPLYRASIGRPCVLLGQRAGPAPHDLLGRIRVHGSRAALAACRRRLRDVVLNLSVSVHLALISPRI